MNKIAICLIGLIILSSCSKTDKNRTIEVKTTPESSDVRQNQKPDSLDLLGSAILEIGTVVADNNLNPLIRVHFCIPKQKQVINTVNVPLYDVFNTGLPVTDQDLKQKSFLFLNVNYTSYDVSKENQNDFNMNYDLQFKTNFGSEKATSGNLESNLFKTITNVSNNKKLYYSFIKIKSENKDKLDASLNPCSNKISKEDSTIILTENKLFTCSVTDKANIINRCKGL